MQAAEQPPRPPPEDPPVSRVRDKSRWMVPLNPVFDQVRDPYASRTGPHEVWMHGLYGVHESLIPEVDGVRATVTPGWMINGDQPNPWGQEWANGFHDDTPEQLLRERAGEIL